MKINLIFFFLLGAMFAAHADTGNAEQTIQQIYKMNVRVFDGGIYDKKYDQSKHCELYKSLFVDELIHVEKVGHACSIISYTGNVRFPNSDIGEIDFPADMPTYHVSAATAGSDGEVAVPVTVDDGSRVIYFLRKINAHYKIINLVTSAKWPRDPNSEDNSVRCPFYFSLSPEHDPFQISVVPKECQKGLWLQ